MRCSLIGSTIGRGSAMLSVDPMPLLVNSWRLLIFTFVVLTAVTVTGKGPKKILHAEVQGWPSECRMRAEVQNDVLTIWSKSAHLEQYQGLSASVLSRRRMGSSERIF